MIISLQRGVPSGLTAGCQIGMVLGSCTRHQPLPPPGPHRCTCVQANTRAGAMPDQWHGVFHCSLCTRGNMFIQSPRPRSAGHCPACLQQRRLSPSHGAVLPQTTPLVMPPHHGGQPVDPSTRHQVHLQRLTSAGQGSSASHCSTTPLLPYHCRPGLVLCHTPGRISCSAPGTMAVSTGHTPSPSTSSRPQLACG